MAQKPKVKDPRITVTFVDPADLEGLDIVDGELFFDLLKGEGEKKRMVGDNRDELMRLWEAGKISDSEALTRLDRLDSKLRANGQGALNDERLKPKKRVNRFVAWAISQGADPKKAKAFAMRHVFGLEKLAGDWGHGELPMELRPELQAE